MKSYRIHFIRHGAIDDTLSEQLKAAFAQFETLFLSMRA